MPDSPLLILGVDAGGSKTALCGRAGTHRVESTGVSVHALRDGIDTAAASLARLIREAQKDAENAELASVCVGLAGAGREVARARIESALRAHLSGVDVHVVHDAEIALAAAFPDATGSVLIVGTGSILFGRTADGERFRAGGWGWRIGDVGSGRALGRAAVRSALAALDGGPPTNLTDRLAEMYGWTSRDDILGAIYADEGEIDIASLAPVLLQAAATEDWVAHHALSRETNALAQQAGWLATRAGDTLPRRLAITGGLASETVYVDALTAALERHLPDWTLSVSETSPAQGAFHLAQRLAENASHTSTPAVSTG